MTARAPIPCPTCGYDLEGLVRSDGAKCPECGGRFTHAQLAHDAALDARLWLPLILVTPVVNAAAGTLALLACIPWPKRRLEAALVVGFFAALVWCVRAERDRRAHLPMPTRRAALADLLMGALMSLITSVPAAGFLWCVNTLIPI